MDDVDLYGDMKSDDVRLRYPNARAKPLNTSFLPFFLQEDDGNEDVDLYGDLADDTSKQKACESQVFPRAQSIFLLLFAPFSTAAKVRGKKQVV